MPLIILTGVPASGKTSRGAEMREYFEKEGKTVETISEWNALKAAGFTKDQYYSDSGKEKQIRGFLKSEVLRLITSRNIVILDAGNGIKGFRYELYCAAKANKCTQCTVHCQINEQQAREFNETRKNKDECISGNIFDEVLFRYEEPDSRNRWDSPLIVVLPDDKIDFKHLSESLLNKEPPKPNMSTQNPPLSSTNFLYELDKKTQDVNQLILQAKNMGVHGKWKVPGHPDISFNIGDITSQQLVEWRRQFITYSKLHVPEVEKISELYLQYLKASLVF